MYDKEVFGFGLLLNLSCLVATIGGIRCSSVSESIQLSSYSNKLNLGIIVNLYRESISNILTVLPGF
jgi:hypothetical protein